MAEAATLQTLPTLHREQLSSLGVQPSLYDDQTKKNRREIRAGVDWALKKREFYQARNVQPIAKGTKPPQFMLEASGRGSSNDEAIHWAHKSTKPANSMALAREIASSE